MHKLRLRQLLLSSTMVTMTMMSGAYAQTGPQMTAPPPLHATGWQYVMQHPELWQGMEEQFSAQPQLPGNDAEHGSSSWQPVANPFCINASNPLLLTDGTVIVHRSCTPDWWRLTPDSHGSYTNGTWTKIASMPSDYTPRFFASAVLPDGRVIAEGGEYNGSPCLDVHTNLGAVYDPLADSWAPVSPPDGWSAIGDASSVVLPNKKFMLANSITKQQALLNSAQLTWSATGQGKFDLNNEEGWTLLWDGNVLTVDAYVGTGTCDSSSELYLTKSGSWVNAGSTVHQLPDCPRSYELGPQVLRPDGTVIAFGGTTTGVAHTSIFQQHQRSWTAGPDIPAVDGVPYTLADAPAALLPSGNVLFAASPSNWISNVEFPRPTHFFEVEYGTNAIRQVADPSATDAASLRSFQWNFLVLPTGQVLVCETDANNVWVYTPAGDAHREWAPVVTAVSDRLDAGTTYTLEGLRLNGFSQGAAYGDDVQADTDYPLVRLTNAVSGHIFYARTFDMRNRAIGLHDRLTSTRFTMPAASEIESGPSYLYVVANGIASEPVPVYVNPGYPVATK